MQGHLRVRACRAHWKSKHLPRLIGIQTTGPLPVKFQQNLLTWWDVCVCARVCECVCENLCVCTWLWYDWKWGLLETLRRFWLKSEGLLCCGLTTPSYNLNLLHLISDSMQWKCTFAERGKGKISLDEADKCFSRRYNGQDLAVDTQNLNSLLAKNETNM